MHRRGTRPQTRKCLPLSQPSRPQGRSALQILEIDPENAGQRIDNFILRQLKGVPRSHLYRLLRRGEVRVNGGRVRPDRRLEVGDLVRIPPMRRPADGTSDATVGDDRRQLAAAVLYEDNHLLVLNKPAGLAVHGGSGLCYGVIEGLRAARPRARTLELVHRLDRDTSGCLMVAKRRSALRVLHEALREGKVEKRYIALVQGRWPRGLQRISAPLRKNVLRGGERFVEVNVGGRPAESQVRILEAFSRATLIEVTPRTGRTHQIRVHAAASGHPIGGDPKYGDASFNRRLAIVGLRRLFLHARSLTFYAPWVEQVVVVTCPLDVPLLHCLRSLREGADAD